VNRWETVEGSLIPDGVSWVEEEQAYNFALYSEHADSVTLLLYADGNLVEPVVARKLDYLENKSGRIWHCRIPDVETKGARYYAYAVDGATEAGGNAGRHRFDSGKILLDPYARSVFFPPSFDRTAAIEPGSNAGKAPLAPLHACRCSFDWSGDRSPRHDWDTVIYELHVKGFTNNPNSGVSPELRGTYLGLIEKLPYLKELGITAVELMPVFQYDPQEENYWGYNPLNFFSPHDGYASSRLACVQDEEIRSMVKALHQEGIEVILDVVYNHTGEGNQTGPIYSFKGIDNDTYYILTGRPEEPYANFSGTGNTLNCEHRYVRKMILDSLRYWVEEMHVDGFRFDLASVFVRKPDGSIDMEDPGLFGDIIADPRLARTRLIAEPWDAAGAYQLGRKLPGITWFQWNDRFRDDVRRFVRGDPGMVPALMYRLYGSDDVFPDDRMSAYHAYQGVNYVNCHDGFTLYDLVSYEQKRNWANGHGNRDGPEESYSWNCGFEGDEGAPPEVLRLRKRQVKNFCCLLFLSNGTPMFRAGDEFLQTQSGNNNPYNQDNETSWLDWSRQRDHQDIFRFFKNMIRFRKAHPSIGRSRFWRDDVRWYGVGPTVDLSDDSRSLAFCLLAGASGADTDIYVMINSHWKDLTFGVQETNGRPWRRMIDTSLESPDDFREPGTEVPLDSPAYVVATRSIVVLIRDA
jgi:glycogen operon protein